jgi:hypothetical protein
VSQLTAIRSQRIILVSEGLRERIWSQRARSRSVVIRDAVDPELFRPTPRLEARRRLGLDLSRTLVLFPHDVTQPTKRIWLAQAAVQELRTIVPAAELWVVNGVPPDEMPLYYAAADVLIVTSSREGGPSSVKEALACGLPVVSVRVGDSRVFEEVKEGGYLSEADPASLAGSVLEAIRSASPERRCLLPSHLTLQSASAQVLQLYRDLA